MSKSKDLIRLIEIFKELSKETEFNKKAFESVLLELKEISVRNDNELLSDIEQALSWLKDFEEVE